MQIATANLLGCFSPLRWAGPIFDKELRVASRRRRLYLLRFAYVGLLAFFVVRLWYSIPHSGVAGSAVVQMSRLGKMGKQIMLLVVWFQFISGQSLAAMLLSDAIGSEVRQRTLDVLLVTPVRSVQIVVGKLLSKMLQLVSLLAISLPMLAVVRVFGGVPWGYVLACLCVTLSAGIFAGSLSLFSSITNRHSYQAALTVVLWDMVVWGLLAMLLMGLSQSGYLSSSSVRPALQLTNPFVVMVVLTQAMTAGFGGAGTSAFWLWHCLILLASAAVLLAWSAWRVRRIVLQTKPLRVQETLEKTASGAGKPRRRGAIRPVEGSPVAWKEACTPLLRRRGQGLLVGGLLIVILCMILLVTAYAGMRALPPVIFLLVQAVQLLFVIDVAVAAAGAVTREKEARTWPVLLMTPLDSRDIIRGKAMGIFRRHLPLLAPLGVLYLILALARPSGQEVVLLLALGLGSVTFFLLGTGLYFSTRLRTTAAAVAATFAAYVAPKFLFCGLLSPLPIVSARVFAIPAFRGGHIVSLPMLAIAAAPAGIYVGVGLLFMRLAARRVRRDIF